jgi:hypothetical protein
METTPKKSIAVRDPPHPSDASLDAPVTAHYEETRPKPDYKFSIGAPHEPPILSGRDHGCPACRRRARRIWGMLGGLVSVLVAGVVVGVVVGVKRG